MASKTQKSLSERIIEAYISYVLTENKEPSSVYAFTKELKISESEFYKHFNRFADIERTIWLDAIQNSINSLKSSKDFATYNAREKVLGLFYTFIEALNKQRSFFVYSLGKVQIPIHAPEGLRSPILDFSKEIIQEGIAGQELEERKFISDRYHEAVWLNTIFILNFWLKDDSKNFEKTDAAIEKSVNLMMELMGKSTFDSMLDLGKFLFQNGLKMPFKL